MFKLSNIFGRKSKNTASQEVIAFYSHKVKNLEEQTLVRAISSNCSHFSTDVLGDATPSFEVGASFSQRMQATKIDDDRWLIHKFTYLDLLPGTVSDLDKTTEPVLIGTAPCAFDALHELAAFQVAAERDGKTVLEGREKQPFIHWRNATRDAKLPLDINGMPVPFFNGVPVATEARRRFNEEQMAIAKGENDPSSLEGLSRGFDRALSPPSIKTPAKASLVDLEPSKKSITWEDLGRPNPRFFGLNSAAVNLNNIGCLGKAKDFVKGLEVGSIRINFHYTRLNEGIFVEKTIDPANYSAPILRSSSLNSEKAIEGKVIPLGKKCWDLSDILTEDVFGISKTYGLKKNYDFKAYTPKAVRRKDGNYDLLGIVEGTVNRIVHKDQDESGLTIRVTRKEETFLLVTRDIENIEYSMAKNIIRNFDCSIEEAEKEAGIIDAAQKAKRQAGEVKRQVEEAERQAALKEAALVREAEEKIKAQAAAKAAQQAQREKEKKETWKKSFFGP